MIAQNMNTVNTYNQEYTQEAPPVEVSREMLLKLLQHVTLQAQRKEQELLAENERLRNKVTQLTEKNTLLEANQQAQVDDLKQMIKRVYQEGEIQLQQQHKRNQLLQMKYNNLNNAFKNLQENVQSFSQIRDISLGLFGDEPSSL